MNLMSYPCQKGSLGISAAVMAGMYSNSEQNIHLCQLKVQFLTVTRMSMYIAHWGPAIQLLYALSISAQVCKMNINMHIGTALHAHLPAGPDEYSLCVPDTSGSPTYGEECRYPFGLSGCCNISSSKHS